MSKPLLFIVPFCSIFILVGIGLTSVTLKKIMRGISAKEWPTTDGTITFLESKDTSSDESTSREIQVRYTYSVNGQALEGKTIHPCYSSSSFEKSHLGIESLLKQGKSVKVYYNPADVEQSTLSVGFYSCSLAAFFGGLIFAGAGVGFLGIFYFAFAGNQNFADGITIIR